MAAKERNTKTNVENLTTDEVSTLKKSVAGLKGVVTQKEKKIAELEQVVEMLEKTNEKIMEQNGELTHDNNHLLDLVRTLEEEREWYRSLKWWQRIFTKL